jgi:hypothetical protein
VARAVGHTTRVAYKRWVINLIHQAWFWHRLQRSGRGIFVEGD